MKQKISVFTVFSHERAMEKLWIPVIICTKTRIIRKPGIAFKNQHRFMNGVNGAIMAVNVIFFWKVPLITRVSVFIGAWTKNGRKYPDQIWGHSFAVNLFPLECFPQPSTECFFIIVKLILLVLGILSTFGSYWTKNR